MKKKSLRLLVAAAALTSIAASANAVPRYNMTILTSCGGNFSAPEQLNNKGQVLYSSQTGVSWWESGGPGLPNYQVWETHEMFWNNGVTTDLGTANPNEMIFGMNDNGIFAGAVYATSYNLTHPAYGQMGQMQDIGTLSGDRLSHGYANAINNLGHVVGTSSDPNGTHAFICKDGEMVNLGGLSTDVLSEAKAINNKDQVIGYSRAYYGGVSRMRAFIWESGKMDEIGVLDGDNYSYAFDINDNGVVIGQSSRSSQVNHHFIWDKVNGMRALRTPDGADFGAIAINNAGLMIGGVTAGNTALIMENGAVYDLNNQVNNASGWQITITDDINDLGQIIGRATLNGETRAVLLTPVPEPSSIAALLAGLGGFGGLIWRRKK